MSDWPEDRIARVAAERDRWKVLAMNQQELLKACLEKLELYRDMVKSEYPGGMPLQVLLPALRKAIASQSGDPQP